MIKLAFHRGRENYLRNGACTTEADFVRQHFRETWAREIKRDTEVKCAKLLPAERDESKAGITWEACE